MPDTTRTFIAVEVPEALTKRLTRLQQQLAPEAPDLGWSVTLPFHITLAFLGDVDVSDLIPVCQAVAKTVARFPRFSIQLDGLGAFPNPGRPRVVFTGVTGTGLKTLEAVQAAVSTATAGLNYSGDGKPFHPHVTLGRHAKRGKRAQHPARDLTPVFNHYKTWHAGPFLVEEIITFSSASTREGVAYTPLARARLATNQGGHKSLDHE